MRLAALLALSIVVCSSSFAAKQLAMTCEDADAASKNSSDNLCLKRKWSKVEASKFIMSSTATSVAAWAQPESKYRAFYQVDGKILVCDRNIAVDLPYEDDKCRDAQKWIAKSEFKYSPRLAFISWPAYTAGTVTEYVIAMGQKQGGPYTHSIKVSADKLSAFVKPPTLGKWYFVYSVKVGNELSPASPEVSKEIKSDAPKSIGVDKPSNSGVE